MLFLDNHSAFDNLMHVAASGQLPHALLLYGADGNPGLLAALELSKLLLCENAEEDIACGSCSSCTKLAKHIHPDLHFVFPVINQKDKNIYKDWYPEWRAAIQENPCLGYFDWISTIAGDNKKGNISAKACNEILHDLGMRAYLGDIKIGIFWMVEYLGKEGNRLLKMIEEPPENTFLFLVTQNRDAILPTILSRCQQVYFGPVPDVAIESALREEFQIPAEKAAQTAILAQGNWNEALRIHKQGNLEPIEMLKSWIRAGWLGTASDITRQSDVMQAMTREEQKQFLSYCMIFFEKLLWRLSGLSAENEYVAEKPVLDFLVQKLDVFRLDRLRKLCEENLASVAFNANQKIMWTDTTIHLRDLLHERESLGVNR